MNETTTDEKINYVVNKIVGDLDEIGFIISTEHKKTILNVVMEKKESYYRLQETICALLIRNNNNNTNSNISNVITSSIFVIRSSSTEEMINLKQTIHKIIM